jgi:hypothetical protein
VILCAGTIENSRLAIQAMHRGRARRKLPRLGGLVDHLVQGFTVRAGRVLMLEGAGLPTTPGSFYCSCDAALRSNLFLEVRRSANNDVTYDFRLCGEQRPNALSFVECDSRAGLPWPTRVRTLLTVEDRAVLAGQRDLLNRIWSELATALGRHARPLLFPSIEVAAVSAATPHGTPDDPVAWSRFLGTEDHEGGTLPLGALLDNDHQFGDVSDLYAAGPSIFPRMGAANPALTTLALARRQAEMIT